MERNLLYIFFFMIGIWSCNDVDKSVFSESADTRLNKALKTYQEQLSGAPNGWKARITIYGGETYNFYLKFDTLNRVKMYSDFTVKTAVEVNESSYRLKALQTPSLIFDTYSYLHILADPDADVNGGLRGKGLVSDFEFAIYPDSITSARMVFVGRKNDRELVLERATNEDEIAYSKGELGKGFDFQKITNFRTYFKRLKFANVEYDLYPDFINKRIRFNWKDGTTEKNFTSHFYYTLGGITLVKPLVNGDTSIKEFSDLVWDKDKFQISVTINGIKTAITEASKPAYLDKEGFNRFRDANDKARFDTFAINRIVVDGVKDFYNLQSIPKYRLLIYKTNYLDSGNDGFFLSTYGGLIGPVIKPLQDVSTGKTTYKIESTVGNDEKLIKLLSDFISEPNGFYFIQKSFNTFDMVSAKDARSMISWRIVF